MNPIFSGRLKSDKNLLITMEKILGLKSKFGNLYLRDFDVGWYSNKGNINDLLAAV